MLAQFENNVKVITSRERKEIKKGKELQKVRSSSFRERSKERPAGGSRPRSGISLIAAKC